MIYEISSKRRIYSTGSIIQKLYSRARSLLPQRTFGTLSRWQTHYTQSWARVRIFFNAYDFFFPVLNEGVGFYRFWDYRFLPENSSHIHNAQGCCRPRVSTYHEYEWRMIHWVLREKLYQYGIVRENLEFLWAHIILRFIPRRWVSFLRIPLRWIRNEYQWRRILAISSEFLDQSES